MKTKSSPSRYRYCISLRSTVATSTLTPALKVRSTTLPDRTFFSLVRTKAPPLPGLTCWKSTTLQSWPSMFRVMPFLRSFVVATSVVSPGTGELSSGLEDEQLPWRNGLGRGEQVTGGRGPGPGTNHQGVLNPYAALAGQVDAWLNGDGNSVPECTRPRVPHHRRLMDLQPHAVAETVAEVLTVPGSVDEIPCCRVHVGDGCSFGRRFDASPLRRRYQVIDLPLPVGRRTEHDRPGHVGVVAVVPGPAVDRDHFTRLKGTVPRRVVRDRPVRAAGHDGVEGRPLRARVDHGSLDEHGQLALRHPGPDVRHHLIERPAGDRARAAEQGEFPGILDHPQVFHAPAERQQQRQAFGGGERGVPLHRHLLRLERQPAQPLADGQLGEGRLDGARDDQLDVGAVAFRGEGVPGIGGEHGRSLDRQQQRRVGAGQAGEVPDVDQGGDERGVRADGGDRGPQAFPAQRMGFGHSLTLRRSGRNVTIRPPASDRITPPGTAVNQPQSRRPPTPAPRRRSVKYLRADSRSRMLVAGYTLTDSTQSHTQPRRTRCLVGARSRIRWRLPFSRASSSGRCTPTRWPRPCASAAKSTASSSTTARCTRSWTTSPSTGSSRPWRRAGRDGGPSAPCTG